MGRKDVSDPDELIQVYADALAPKLDELGRLKAEYDLNSVFPDKFDLGEIVENTVGIVHGVVELGKGKSVLIDPSKFRNFSFGYLRDQKDMEFLAKIFPNVNYDNNIRLESIQRSLLVYEEFADYISSTEWPFPGKGANNEMFGFFDFNYGYFIEDSYMNREGGLCLIGFKTEDSLKYVFGQMQLYTVLF